MESEKTMQSNGNSGGKSLRLLRPSIVVLCGPAGGGKSTFAEKHFRPTQIISSDWARGRICDDERDQRFNHQAFALVHFLLEQRLTLNRLCVVDSTAITAQARKDLVELARKYQVPITLMWFNIPLETCVERDQKRQRTVGRPTIERQYQQFEQAKAQIGYEGFDQVVELEDSDLDAIHIEILFRPVMRTAPRSARPAGSDLRKSDRPVLNGRPSFAAGNGNSQPSAVPANSSGGAPQTVRPASTEKVVPLQRPESSQPRPQPAVKPSVLPASNRGARTAVAEPVVLGAQASTGS
jgi:predicted kinase